MRTCHDFIQQLTLRAANVVARHCARHKINMNESCAPLLRLGLANWQQSVAIHIPRAGQQEILSLGGEIYDLRMRWCQDSQVAAEAAAVMLPSMPPLEAEYARLQEWKKNEPDPLDCHRHDHILMALETVIRHFKEQESCDGAEPTDKTD